MDVLSPSILTFFSRDIAGLFTVSYYALFGI